MTSLRLPCGRFGLISRCAGRGSATLVFVVCCRAVLAFRVRSDPERRPFVCFRASSDYIGRVGIEPTTLGLKVDAAGFACSRVSSPGGMVNPNRIG
ncbi:MAG: hypothetical protein QOE97_1016 [Pseudonocardiales bacterium]|nr:hypothetical protein [Pseudonocardiales bacterium]